MICIVDGCLVVFCFVDGVVGDVVEQNGTVGFCIVLARGMCAVLDVLTEPEIKFDGNACVTCADVEGVFCPLCIGACHYKRAFAAVGVNGRFTGEEYGELGVADRSCIHGESIVAVCRECHAV